MSDSPDSAVNPLLQAWRTPLETPPFAAIRPEHFMPAFEQAFADHAMEVAAIVNDPTDPDFDNTVTAWERSGRLLNRISAVFYDLVSANSNPELLAIESEVALRMARHWNPIMMNAVLFGRVARLHHDRHSMGLTEEQQRLLERLYTRMHRAGAGLDEAAKARMSEINERLAALSTTFSHHLLGDEQDWTLELGADDLGGLSPAFVAAARASAAERGLDGKAVVTLSRSSVEPFLQSSTRRDLREKVYKAFTARGDNGNANDNSATIREILALREETARILGYANFAAYRLEDSMAKTPEAVRSLLERVWEPARAKALADRDALQELIREDGGNFALAPWDWRFYAEKLRQRRANFDDAAIKPYLVLDHMIEAAFDVAHRLFGLSFSERHDIPVWHPDVRVWEVTDAAGAHKALFYGDYFARASKRSGAWMTSLRDQQKLDGGVSPLIINVMNFAKGADGHPALLSPDDARTLFHEFGHGLHGMLSDVVYPSLSGTSVFTDFVELPSQLYEHWQQQPAVLRRFARHYQTGEPLPDDLLQRFLAARKFNQGFATVEFLASALMDMEFHSHPVSEIADVRAFERQELDKIGMPSEIAMRHRPQQFGHIFSGDHYAAGYYSYMWSEVMDADAFGAFEEAGDIFDPAVAKRLHDNIYSSGGSRDPEEAYVAFRGREPEVDALLRGRGLLDAPEPA
ncbi:M3 family metallopeptidase [Bradyrhizobium sp. U87765 SZCCT0131]|uniref:M3 family metallopeptidase n=1 Tax=unclassified Bradyrhizobium TaxID=2631580 RepID=UPI001BA95832|nr:MULTISPECIES: M3 family metallopeptidase [unclassified Bradyrhizobium]MBR1218725.1 M3 family metallopeptidase [Bradyrhizobium sp. U87765 SZCCT0131]MBR1265516.1 M3 family metallopeptidase [Bradyrhizobium sp. U87765 SZCCT0134]MBR1304224.1 M3 family metallopeptidase [Bradyrhizobium sp. U87765 SZCCT0110]MBR1319829.1 M3 family metallopeptidase [Bradyrhizobium sp. U87765 SZCCT0109]MBR1348155.1 M3 family metallopeptidase [Bradyrhizobium sp. U87765 SZCCT0048]